jgi:hypothetical protein
MIQIIINLWANLKSYYTFFAFFDEDEMGDSMSDDCLDYDDY